MNHRQIFGIAACRAVNGAQLANAERGQQRRSALAAGVAVCGISGVEFIGAPYPRQAGMSDHPIKKCQIKVARHAKQMIDTDFIQSL